MAPNAAEVETKASAHPPTKRLSFPRHKSLWKYTISVAMSFFVWHYVVHWVPVAFAFGMLVYLQYLHPGIVMLLLAAYFSQMMLTRPQYERGWKCCYYVRHHPLWDHGLRYFDAEIIREGDPEELKKYKQFVFAYCPHGILGLCRFATAGTGWNKLFPGIFGRWGSFGMAYNIPLVREWSLMVGAVDASKPVMQYQLDVGDSVHLTPGGIQEMMLTECNSKDTKLVLGNRKGFVRLCVENGVPLVPVFCFGEKWACHPLRLPKSIASLLHSRFRLSGTAPIGRFYTFLPFNYKPDGSPLRLGWVFGVPIPVNKMSPSDPAFEPYVDKIHAEFCDRLHEIFNRYKAEFGYSKDETLTIVDAKTRQEGKLSGPESPQSYRKQRSDL